jgi:cyanophycinase
MGKLFLIGGKAKQCVAHFVALAGGVEANVLVVPHASSVHVKVAAEMTAELVGYGVKSVTCALPGEPLVIAPNVNAVYICGGDQAELVRLLGEDGAEKLRRFHAAGGLIAGTSAGAAAAGVDIITAGMPSDSQLRFGELEMGKGLALCRNVIFDTHFLQRARFNRLIAAVAQFPRALGIGLDEDTALLIETVCGVGKKKASLTMTAYGFGHAWFYRAGRGLKTSLKKNVADNEPGALYSVSGVTVSVLSAGQSYGAVG